MKTIVLLFGISFLMLSGCKKEDSPGANEVFIRNLAFNPASMTVSAGTTVKWTDKETITHTVTSDTGLFNSGDLTNGQTFSFNFTTPGTYAYHCNHHSTMHGTITVY